MAGARGIAESPHVQVTHLAADAVCLAVLMARTGADVAEAMECDAVPSAGALAGR